MQARILAIIEAVEASAACQRHLITSREAKAARLSSRVVRELVARSRWRREAPGVYAVEGRDGGPLQKAHATVLSLGDGAFVQRRTAAEALGKLDLDYDGSIDVAGAGRGGSRRSVPERHIIVASGLRTTDALVTLIDLAGGLDDIPWEWVLEAALRNHGLTVPTIEAALPELGRRQPSAVRRVRRVLALRPPWAPPTGSLLETRFVQLARSFGAPDPVRQHVVAWPDGRFVARVDLCWPELGVFVELDGQAHLDQPVYDASRETDVVAATGWMCGRFTWREVVVNPTPTGRKLLKLLDQARRRPVPA